MQHSILELKSISELLDENFCIPSYQRGYRWGSRQVVDLLDDIIEFARKKARSELKQKEFYCLQPIVVKKEDNEFTVIDGQQRLTTLFIILKYLEQKIKDDYYIENFYKIKYITRDSKDESNHNFLETINSICTPETKNIDFYYMSNAFITIKNWFETNKVNKGDFLNVLLKSDIQNESDKKVDLANNIRVIWYEINNENPIDVFVRLNIGKIPLTNAELIKALFLINTKEENKKIILASQWDDIEYRLSNNKFFSFVNSSKFNRPTKIEYIFDLIANNILLEMPNLQNNDEKRSYYIFNELIQNQKAFVQEFKINENEQNKFEKPDARIEFLWDKVKTYFRIFNELYNNNEYYHLVGYLVHNEINIQRIVDAFINNSKEDFLNFLTKKIKNTILTNKEIHKLTYTDDYKLITRILFLFNVVSAMKGKDSKYPFNLHLSEKWSLEHIHAQNSEKIKQDQDRKSLLKEQKDYVSKNDIMQLNSDSKNVILQKIQNLIDSDKIENEDFDDVQKEIFKLFSDDYNIDTIDNLSLLSKNDNSSLNNNIFPIKRDTIKELDKKGSFIPICTKNVFLKYYSNNVKEAIMWNKEDRAAYLQAIKETLKEYHGEDNV